MGTRETSLTRPALSALAADINTDPRARAAWLEVAAARMAAHIMRAARERSGLSQSDLARALDVSQARISQVESGRVENIPPLEFLMRFVDACGEELQIASVQSVQQHPEDIVELTVEEAFEAESIPMAAKYHSEG